MYNYFLIIGKIFKLKENSVILLENENIVEIVLGESVITLLQINGKIGDMIGVKGKIVGDLDNIKLVGERVCFYGKH